jgi:decaprenyl-phosphate phosphoribosyltransferase
MRISGNKKIKILFRLSRPRQWIKSLLIFIAPIISGEISNWGLQNFFNLFSIVLVFITSSIFVYCFNDVLDSNIDVHHNNKKNRPIAAKQIDKFSVIFFALFVLAISLIAGAMISPSIIRLQLLYIIINIFYSLYIKHIAFWEMFIVSFGFFIRAIAGSNVVEKKPSAPFYIVIFFGALLIVLSKRISELTSESKFKRQVLDCYSKDLLISIATTTSTIVLGAYVYFISSEYFINNSATRILILDITIFPFLAVIFEIMSTIVKGGSEEPELYYVKNRRIQINFLIWIILFVSATH